LALTYNDLESRRRAAPYQPKLDSASKAFHIEQLQDFTHPINRLPIPGCNNVADQYTSTRGRPLRIKTHDENSSPSICGLRSIWFVPVLHGSETGTQVSAINMAPSEELINGAIDC
jgi:hypothetical protein